MKNGGKNKSVAFIFLFSVCNETFLESREGCTNDSLSSPDYPM